MKTVIITNAGISSRFNKDVPPEQVCLKAIYYNRVPKDTLLYHMLKKCGFADRIILVGGYLYEELKGYVAQYVPEEIRAKLQLVYNEHYEDLASGYSLYVGLQEALKEPETESVLFAEGDLDLDDATFQKMAESERTVLSCNHTPIYANKAVVLYQREDGTYRYAFNSAHGLLQIREPFSCIFNSGQVWKFTDMQRLKEAAERFYENERGGTNLVIIQDYLDHTDPAEVETVAFERWVNCNTREDFAGIEEGWKH